MRRDGLAGPFRKCLARGGIAEGEDEVENRSARLAELAPMLGPQPLGRIPALLEDLKRCRVDLPCRVDGGAERTKTTLAMTVHDRFGHQAPRRIAPRYEKHVVGPIHRASPRRAPDLAWNAEQRQAVPIGGGGVTQLSRAARSMRTRSKAQSPGEMT